MASVNQPKMYSLSVQLLNQTKYWYHKNQKINMASVNQPNMDFKLCIGLIYFGNWEDPNKFRFRLHQTTYHISREFYHPFFLR